ncbi:MAG: hypothetical protein ACW97A_01205 [Candidatus Thorarchaeota archaeon]|jgi:hypothetical protein
MEKEGLIKILIPITITLIVVVSILILGGIASENPDGFEWALFDFAGIEEPASSFDGIWAFLGSDPVIDVIAGGVGILMVMIIAFFLFRAASRRTE